MKSDDAGEVRVQVDPEEGEAEEEKKGTRRLRWADVGDNEEGGRQETEEERKVERSEKKRGSEKRKRGAAGFRGRGERAQEAREEEKRAQGEREKQVREAKAEEERREQEREVEAEIGGIASIARDELSRSVLCEDSMFAHTDVTMKLTNKALCDICHSNVGIERRRQPEPRVRADHLFTNGISSSRRRAERGHHGFPEMRVVFS